MTSITQTAMIAIGSTVLFSYAYFLILGYLERMIQRNEKNSPVSHYLARKSGGVLLLGIVPAVLFYLIVGFSPADAGMCWAPRGHGWAWFALGIPVIVLVEPF